MHPLILSFLFSLSITILLIRTQNFHSTYSADHIASGIQKFHRTTVPRIGGIGIFMGLLLSTAISSKNSLFFDTKSITLIICAIPVFGIGLLEDLTKLISIRVRLLFTSIGALLAIYLLNVQIKSLGIPGLDLIVSIYPFSAILTVFAIVGLSNSYNIIDGFNGLSSMVAMITLGSIGYIGIDLNDPLVTWLSFSMCCAILGFFICNYPKGLIFLGDGGAYFIGFWIAVICIMLVDRHSQISPWFALLINGYPILETLFTIYRRVFHQNKSPGHPDGLHIHSLIFRRILGGGRKKPKAMHLNPNSKTSTYLWGLASIAIIPAVFFYDDGKVLIVFFLIFVYLYVWLYKRIVSFRTPKFLEQKK